MPLRAAPLDERSRQQALVVAEAAGAAYRSGDLARAAELYEAAYAIYPSDKLQYSLGVTYQQLKRWLPAARAFQRYLALPQSERTPDRDKVAHAASPQLMANLGRVLVYGDAGLAFHLDAEPAATLPQAPLLVTPGVHQVRSAAGGARVEVGAGALVVVKLSRAEGPRPVTAAAQQGRLLVLPQGGATAAVVRQQPLVSSVMQAAAQEASLALVDPGELEALWSAEPELRGCERPECLARLGELVGGRILLLPRLAQDEDGTWHVTVAAFNVPAGDHSAREAGECAAGAREPLRAVLLAVARRALAADAARPRGTIKVESEPTHADVFIDGRRRGFTPYQGAAFAGRHDVAVQRLGRRTVHRTVSVDAGATVSERVTLPEGIDTDAQRIVLRDEALPRPRWRKVVGGVLIGMGAAAVASGAVLASLSGHCYPRLSDPLTAPECAQTFHSAPLGYTLVGLGAAGIIGGVINAALPGPRRQVEVKLSGVGLGYGLHLAGGF